MKQGKANRVLPRERTAHRKHPLPITQKKILHMDLSRWSTTNQIDSILCSQRWRSSRVHFSSVQSLSHVWLFATHESQHARPPCPWPTPGVYSNSCPASLWCHPAISSTVIPFSSCPQSLPASGSFPMSQLCMRWPKYWSFNFSISPSSEHPGLISFRMDWLDLLAVQRESSLTPRFKSINFSVLSFLHSPRLTSLHDHWKNHSLD